MEKDILGKWVQSKDEAYPGLYFIFKEDGAFEAYYDALGVVSGGTYQTQGNQIDIDQTSHTFGLIGKFEGIYEIEGNILRLALVGAGEQPRPTTLDLAVVYLREES